MAFVPGEVPAETGDAMRSILAEATGRSEEHVWVVGYANGHFGYVVPMRAGPDDYEQLMCDLEPSATEQILMAVARLSSRGCASVYVKSEIPQLRATDS